MLEHLPRRGLRREEVIGIDTAVAVRAVRLLIERRIGDAETRARSFERLGEQRADILFDDRLCRLTVALALADRAEHRGVALDAALHFVTAGIGDEEIAVIARLAIGEAEHALFAERVAAIAGEDVEQVVRVAQAVRIPLHLIVILRAPHLVALGDEARGRQSLAAHESDIGVADAALGQRVDPAMIVKQVGQIGFAFHQLPAEIACHKGARIVHEALARQIFEDVEDLLGIFLVPDQLAEVLERLERTELLRLAVGVGEDGGDHGGSRSNQVMLLE